MARIEFVVIFSVTALYFAIVPISERGAKKVYNEAASMS